MRKFLTVVAWTTLVSAIAVGLLNARDFPEFVFWFLTVALPAVAILIPLFALTAVGGWLRLGFCVDTVVALILATAACDGDAIAWLIIFVGAALILPVIVLVLFAVGGGALLLSLLRPNSQSGCGCSGSCHCEKPYC